MKRYESPIDHAPFILSAIALTALTMALAVVLPARVDFPVHQQRSLSAAKAVPAPTEVLIIPARIDVVGPRAQETAFEPAGVAAPKAKQPS
jgi:hypothetical protein